MGVGGHCYAHFSEDETEALNGYKTPHGHKADWCQSLQLAGPMPRFSDNGHVPPGHCSNGFLHNDQCC